MKVALFILFYTVFYVSSAFSSSLLQSHFKGKLSQTSPKEIVSYHWDGFYTGLILGGQFGRSSDKTGAFGYNADNDKWDYNEAGFNAGAEFGYNYSWHRLAIGPEIELGYLGMGGSGAQPNSPGLDTVGKSSSDFYTTFRARLGAVFDRSLIFATGGVIGVNYKKQIVDSCNIAPCGGSTVDAQKNDFTWGYTVGGGIEHLLDKGWSAKLECLYFSLNDQSFSGATNLGNTYDWTGQTLGYIIRGGLNYHF